MRMTWPKTLFLSVDAPSNTGTATLTTSPISKDPTACCFPNFWIDRLLAWSWFSWMQSQKAVETWLATAIDAEFSWKDSIWGESDWSSRSKINSEGVTDSTWDLLPLSYSSTEFRYWVIGSRLMGSPCKLPPYSLNVSSESKLFNSDEATVAVISISAMLISSRRWVSAAS